MMPATIIEALRRARQFVADEKALIVETGSLIGEDRLPIAGTLDQDAAEEIAGRYDPLLAQLDAAIAAAAAWP